MLELEAKEAARCFERVGQITRFFRERLYGAENPVNFESVPLGANTRDEFAPVWDGLSRGQQDKLAVAYLVYYDEIRDQWEELREVMSEIMGKDVSNVPDRMEEASAIAASVSNVTRQIFSYEVSDAPLCKKFREISRLLEEM